jgi:hypothetical protein
MRAARDGPEERICGTPAAGTADAMTGGGEGAALDGASPREDIADPFGGGA